MAPPLTLTLSQSQPRCANSWPLARTWAEKASLSSIRSTSSRSQPIFLGIALEHSLLHGLIVLSQGRVGLSSSDIYGYFHTEPPDQTSWWGLSSLMKAEPETAIALWERIKQTAREELENGHLAAETFDWNSGPWDRAQFLAVRSSFRSEWKPQGGIESSLIDTMAQTYTAYMYWMQRLHIQADSYSKVQDMI
jgi:hypothetical protein